VSRFHRILVPVDFSEHAEAAFERALAIAKSAGAELHLFHAYDFPYSVPPIYNVEVPPELVATVRDAAARQIEKLRAEAEAAGVPCETHLSADGPGAAIAQRAVELRADLVVMGTRGLSGLRHVLLGSTSERTVRSAPCPVLTVKAGSVASGPFKVILVPVAFGKHSEDALAVAIELARESQGRLHLVHAYEVPTMMAAYGIPLPPSTWRDVESTAEARMKALCDRVAEAGVAYTSELATAPASDAIIDAATRQHADLIVMGTRQRVGLQHVLLGSVAERTLRLAPCPVLTVHSAGD
jgi:nucleotide-binding universal stress UspA family protein